MIVILHLQVVACLLYIFCLFASYKKQDNYYFYGIFVTLVFSIGWYLGTHWNLFRILVTFFGSYSGTNWNMFGDWNMKLKSTFLLKSFFIFVVSYTNFLKFFFKLYVVGPAFEMHCSWYSRERTRFSVDCSQVLN